MDLLVYDMVFHLENVLTYPYLLHEKNFQSEMHEIWKKITDLLQHENFVLHAAQNIP